MTEGMNEVLLEEAGGTGGESRGKGRRAGKPGDIEERLGGHAGFTLVSHGDVLPALYQLLVPFGEALLMVTWPQCSNPSGVW